MMINNDLKKYIEKNIFKDYEKNDSGHNLEHIKYVIKRSFIFAKTIKDINYDMLYTIAAYHDIAHHIDAKNHEKISADILLNDENLKSFFNKEQIKTMAEAVYDHRASMQDEPRNIYGKIVSSADRNTSVPEILKRAYAYRVKHYPSDNLNQIVEESRQHILNKFGEKGYAIEKMYFKDHDYEKFLIDILKLTNNEKLFKQKFLEINKLNKK